LVVALSEGLDRIEAQESLQCKPDPDLEHDPVSDLRRRPFVLFVVARNSDFVARRSVHGHVYTRHISRSSNPVSGSESNHPNPLNSAKSRVFPRRQQPGGEQSLLKPP
jgi:hypothetical protein